MPQPTAFSRSYDFTSFQEQYSDQPLPAAQIDANLDAAGTSINQIINRMELIQADDGGLKNGVVGLEAFSTVALAALGTTGLNPRGAWVTATAYAKLDLVTVSGVTYVCVTAHTSGTFITDKDTNGYWIVFSNPAVDSGTSFFQKFSGTGSQTVFTLSNDLGTDENALMIFVDAGGTEGFEIQLPTAFTVNGTSLTFGSAPALGTDNVYVFAPSLLLGAVGSAAADAEAAKTAAEAAQTAAEAAQTGAETAETNAGTSETNAASSASAASTSASTASTAATNAGNAQTAAETAQGAAETAQAAAEAVLVDSDFVAVAGDLTGADTIGTVAGSISSVNAVAAVDTEVGALGALTSEITALAAVTSALSTLSPYAADLGSYADFLLQINSQTGTTYQFVAGDAGKYVRGSNASAQTYTVPPNATVAFSTGTQIVVRQAGAGQITIAEGSGVTVNTSQTLKTRAQHSTITLIKVGTNEWDMSGDMEAA